MRSKSFWRVKDCLESWILNFHSKVFDEICDLRRNVNMCLKVAYLIGNIFSALSNFNFPNIAIADSKIWLVSIAPQKVITLHSCRSFSLLKVIGITVTITLRDHLLKRERATSIKSNWKGKWKSDNYRKLKRKKKQWINAK